MDGANESDSDTGQEGAADLERTPRDPTMTQLLNTLYEDLDYAAAVYRTEPPVMSTPTTEDLAGIVITPLLPGNNTCPLCRATVFAKPADGDSLRFVRFNLLVWDHVYKQLGIKRAVIEEVYRHECMNFIRNWEKDQNAMGERQRDSTLVEEHWIVINAAHMLCAIEDYPDAYGHLLQKLTRRQKRGLWEAGAELKRTLETNRDFFDGRIDTHLMWKFRPGLVY